MKLSSVLRIGVACLILAVSGRALYLQSEIRQRQRLTSELCSLVAGYLETSADRSAFEGMQQGIARSSYSDACISVVDQGKHYTPDCTEPDTNYQVTLCKVEGNRGVQAQILYKVAPLFSLALWVAWLSLWAATVFVLTASRAGSTYFAKRITEELRVRLFGEVSGQGKEGPIARVAQWLVVKSGILSGVRTQTERFESQIREYEGKIRTEAILRVQKEMEVQKSKERLEEIKKIRHDLDSPLSSFLSVQDKFVGDELSRKALAVGIQKIQRMLDRLGQTEVNPDAPRLTIVETVAEEAVALIRSKFKGVKQVSVFLSYDTAALSPVNATPDGLMRILNNLLENAFDASSTGGKILVRVSSEDSHCKISVDDEGCGVSPEVVPRLFEKGATFGKVNGTGYGLYESKDLIESWKGTIQMEPLERGTRFIISLPKLQVSTAFVGLPKVTRLWVIDDDRSVSETLDESGFEVVESALTYDDGRSLLNKPIPANVAVLVDFRLDAQQLGTDLIAGHKAVQQIYLCTSDFDNPEVIKKARQIGVRIIPKSLCYLAKAQDEQSTATTLDVALK